MNDAKGKGYRMPAEWEPHSDTWLIWPHNMDTWPNCMKEVEEIYAMMVGALSKNEQVNILVNDQKSKDRVLEKLRPTAENVLVHIITTYDSWIRDYGPIFVRNNSEMVLIDWKFNAWGGKYEPWPYDDDIPSKIAALLKIPSLNPDIVFEGGSIDVNGLGTCITTESCLLHPNRNPQLNKESIENFLKEYLGLQNIIWLKGSIAGDDTDGHIDDIARFVNPNTVVCCLEEDPNDENYSILMENYSLLLDALNQNGKKLNIVPLPMPGIVDDGARRLPASYANFYIANDVVLVPTFNHPNDKRAIRIIQGLFPRREVIGIYSRALVEGFGAFHCLTQQQPAL